MREREISAGVKAQMLSINKIINGRESCLLSIPTYQRPYTWTAENVFQLLEDINNSRNVGKRTYLIGSVILYSNREENKIDIVDGQQRLTTIALIQKAISVCIKISPIKMNLMFSHDTSFQNIAVNYKFIEEWIASNIKNEEEKFWNYLIDNCQFVRIEVSELGEAFQMFDSQNGRGKSLFAYNLLKAYHMRAMDSIKLNRKAEKELYNEKILCDKRWENAVLYAPIPGNANFGNIDILATLFNNQLYKTRIWCKKMPAQNFSKEKIGEFKGFSVGENSSVEFPFQNSMVLYCLAGKSYLNADKKTPKIKSRFKDGDPENMTPFATMNQPIVNGKPFFEYVETYVEMYKKMFVELNSYELAEFKEFYYKYCLNYGYKKSSGNSGRFSEGSHIPVGLSNRIGDTYLREVYKSIVFLLFDKFGESVLLEYYRYLYKIVYSQRLEKARIDPSSYNLQKFPIPYFNIIFNARNKADLSELKSCTVKCTAGLGKDSPVKLDKDVVNFIRNQKI